MSASYENKREGFIKMGILEASKSLFITGKRKESCELLHGNEIYVQNESDEFMKFYCNIDTRNQLVEMKSSLELLAKKDSGLIFRSYLNFGGKQKGFEEAGDE